MRSWILSALWITGCASYTPSAITPTAPVTAQESMVACAHPEGARAGQWVMEAGGSAVDATIAMIVTLTMVEPQSAGIGGGAFLLHFDAETKAVSAFDGRETAPASAHPDMFLDESGAPRGFRDAVVGGLSVGVPGLIRMLSLAHRQHGRLPWAKLFEPAIRLAEEGFLISPRLHALLENAPDLRAMRVAGSHYYDENGAAHPVGYRLKNPAYATTLRTVASQGADAFYTGPLAASISHAVTHAERNPTALTVADMSAYQAKEREALCRNYRSFEVCGMPPPTSGGVIPLQILGLLSHFELSPTPSGELEAAHLFAEASRLAYADRSLYLADPDFVSVPVNGLLAPNYLRARAGQIHRDRSLGTAQPGTPPGADPTSLAPNRAPEIPGTTHLVAVDAQGNAVSMTASIEGAFGSHLMVGGFLLNNELTDFSFVPEQEGRAVANRVQPGKRPLSSMSPTLVFQRDGAHRRFYLALGSPGGSRIIEYVTWTLIRILDFGLDVQTAMSRPLVVNRNGDTEIETLPAFESWAEELRKYLEHRGHRTQLRELGSGLHGIRVTEDGYEGGADPRREGLVLGR